MIRFLTILFIQALLFTGLSASAQNTDFLMDERDGNVYLLAKFGDTWWMCQNLKYNIGEGDGCYNDDENNCMLRGRLYNQAAAIKACPEGYHLPGDDEWKALESYIGMDDEDLDNTANRISGTVGKILRMGGGIGFDADYAGMINPRGNSTHSGNRAYFWTSSEVERGKGWLRIIEKNNDGVGRRAMDNKHMLSIRCVKKAVAEPHKTIKETEKK